MLKFLAILPLAGIAYYAWALHRGLGLYGAWVQWRTRDISTLLTGKAGALVDRAFYLAGAALIFAGWLLAGVRPAWIPFGVGGAALAGAALSRAVWPQQEVHVLCALLAFAGIAGGNAYVAYLWHSWLLFIIAAVPLPLIGIWRQADIDWAHGFEWCAAGAVLAVTSILLLLHLLGAGR